MNKIIFLSYPMVLFIVFNIFNSCTSLMSPKNNPPVFTSISDTIPDTVTVGSFYRLNVYASDPENDEIQYTLIKPVYGMDLTHWGFFSWEPFKKDTGSHTISVVAHDKKGGCDTLSWIINVGYSEPPPLKRQIVMKKIPGGTFMMGQVGIAEPVHQVTLSAFSMQETHVTFEQYRWLMGPNLAGSKANDTELQRPVVYVSWYDAILFCNELSKLYGLDTVYKYNELTSYSPNVIIDYSKKGYRLPTEAEYEYACRGGTTTTFWWGNDSSSAENYAWVWSNCLKTCEPVAKKPPNPYGLYDISGNAEEWCNDWYGPYTAGAAINPMGSDNSSKLRVLRGGAFDGGFVGIPVADRDNGSPSGWSLVTSFRVVLTEK